MTAIQHFIFYNVSLSVCFIILTAYKDLGENLASTLNTLQTPPHPISSLKRKFDVGGSSINFIFFIFSSNSPVERNSLSIELSFRDSSNFVMMETRVCGLSSSPNQVEMVLFHSVGKLMPKSSLDILDQTPMLRMMDDFICITKFILSILRPEVC